MDNLSGGDLVKAVQAENPDMSISEVLDKTRAILFNRNVKIAGEHKNVFQFLKTLMNLNMTREEIGRAAPGISHLDDAIEFITSTLEVDTPQTRCFPWITAGKGKKRGTGLRPPK